MRSLALCLLFVVLLSPRSWAAVIAVLTEEGSGEVATVLEAELAKHTGLKLIDRTQITRVMAEQKLTALQKPESAVQFGRLVRADGVLLVSKLKVAGKPILAARLVATTPGVVLWSIVRPADVFEPWVNGVADRTGDSAAKLTVRQGDATAIAILIFVMNADGSGLRNITNAWGDDEEPAWSPDGKQLAFISRFGGRKDLCVIAMDGSGRRTIQSGEIAAPAWSPDGQHLAFAMKAESMTGICEFDLARGTLRNIVAKAPMDSHPTYWPDGSRLAYIQRFDKGRYLAQIGVDGQGEKQLLRVNGADWPAVSTDGRRLLFRSGGPDSGDKPGPYDVLVFEVASGTTKRLTNDSGMYGRMAWSK
jgi:hypothetical protein